MRAETPPEVERELAAIDDALAGRAVDPDLAGLALLAGDLREERPAIDGDFAADLDRRAAAGFSREGGRFARWRASRPALMPAVAFAACLLLALAVSVSVLRDREQTGAPAGSGGSSAGSGGAAALESAEDAQRAAPASGESDPAPDRGSAGAEPGVAVSPSTPDSFAPVPPVPGPGSPASDRRRDRKVERSASMTLAAPAAELQRVADEIVRVTDGVGGFVVTSSVSMGDSGASGGTFELRVPSRRLPQALADLSRLAHVRERRQATRDITAQAVSAREQLQEARAERRSLLRRLERASDDAETRTLRARLRHVTRRIGAARAEVARVDNRARFSTVLVVLALDPGGREREEEDDGVWSPGDAARDAVRVLEVAAGVALIALAVLVPLGLVAALGAVAARSLGRRRRERALDAS